MTCSSSQNIIPQNVNEYFPGDVVKHKDISYSEFMVVDSNDKRFKFFYPDDYSDLDVRVVYYNYHQRKNYQVYGIAIENISYHLPKNRHIDLKIYNNEKYKDIFE